MQAYELRTAVGPRLYTWLLLMPLLALALAGAYTLAGGAKDMPVPRTTLSVDRGPDLAAIPATAYNQPEVTILGDNRFLVSVVTTEMTGAERILAAPASITQGKDGWTLCYATQPLEAISAQPTPVRLQFEMQGAGRGDAPIHVGACTKGAAAKADRFPWRGF